MLALTLLTLAASALALEVDTPTQSIHSSSNTTITWSAESGDPAFNIFIFATVFNDRYAIANNVPSQNQSITLELPEVLVGDYVYQFTNITNNTDIYAETDSFPIAASCESGCDSTSVISSSSSATGSGSESGTASATASGAAATTSDNAAATLGAPALVGVVAGMLAYLTL